MKYWLGALASSSGSSGEGAKAPDFEFSMFQGIEEVGFRNGNLARLEGKPLVLNFWAGARGRRAHQQSAEQPRAA